MMQSIGIKQIIAGLLLIVGVQFWLVIGHGMLGRDYSKWLGVGIFRALSDSAVAWHSIAPLMRHEIRRRQHEDLLQSSSPLA